MDGTSRGSKEASNGTVDLQFQSFTCREDYDKAEEKGEKNDFKNR